MTHRFEIASISHALGLMGLSQRDVARHISYSQATLSRMARRPIENLRYGSVVEVAEGIVQATRDQHPSFNLSYEVKRDSEGKTTLTLLA